MYHYSLFIVSFICVLACSGKQEKTGDEVDEEIGEPGVSYASGLSIEKEGTGVTIVKVATPWPDARQEFTYALVPKELAPVLSLDSDAYDAIVMVPVERVIVTSTTHIPALKALGVLDKLVGFPDTRYVSTPEARALIDEGLITDIGSNEAVNTEMAMALEPDLFIGFAVNNRNRAYDVLQQSNIPVVYNADWTEESPLGKAEWIKFFAPFFGKEQQADSLFKTIEKNYIGAMGIADKAANKPKVLSGALYKDVWYLPGGSSWASRFLEDANAHYLWSDSRDVGSLSLSVESVLEKAGEAEYWISPSQYTSYEEMGQANRHYSRIKAFRDRKVYTFAKTRGASGGLLYYELAPSRPDLVLKDLIHILHPGVLPDHEPYFFKPLD